MATRLDIIIVSFNARADLEQCLRSLHRYEPATPHRITVVDNASADGSADAVRTEWPGVRVIEAGDNVGFSRASNIGIREANGELILLLNNDTIVPAGAIDRLVGELGHNPSAAIAGPRIVDAYGRAELSFGRMMGPLTEPYQKLLVSLHDRHVGLVSRHVERLTRRSRLVDWVSGACLLVRRLDAVAAGLLDERYFLYCEDVDFCAAVRALGREVRFVPAAEVIHLRGRSRAIAAGRADRAYRDSHVAFYSKHHPFWLPVLRAYLALKGKRP